MKILLLTQLFQPEPNHLKGLAFAKALARQGHDVRVLTGFPNYPGGKLYPNYRMSLIRNEMIDGIPILRIAHYLYHGRSSGRRILSYLSFAASATLLGPFFIRRPDIVHVYQGPSTLALPAMFFKLIFRSPYLLDIQDIWPESVSESGLLPSKAMGKLLHIWCGLTYRISGRIVVLSRGYKDVLIERGVPPEKIDVVLNWCDEEHLSLREQKSDQPAPHGLSETFNVLYAGNMGKLQDLGAVLKAAQLLQPRFPQIRFIFVGGGIDLPHLESLAATLALNNVRFIPRVPAPEMRAIYDHAAALIVHLKNTFLARIGIPQKIQAYLAAGKPIVAAVPGAAAELVLRAAAGVVCESENETSIAAAVEKLFEMSEIERQRLGANGRLFYQTELAFDVGVRKMTRAFEIALMGC